MNVKYLYILVSTIALALLTLTAFTSSSSFDDEIAANRDLINFSHSFHGDYAECTDCHSAVPESISLDERLLPSHEDCGSCHEVDDDEECSTCHKDGIYKRLIQTKSKLIFNHKNHLNRELECIECHKDFTAINYSEEAVQKVPPMEFCVNCHSSEKIAPNYCENCHISTAVLTPQSHITGTFKRDHKYLAESFDANCMMCHNNSTCDECHISTTSITEQNTADDFYQPYMPSQSIDGSKQQIIERRHELNYRYIHGIDANSKLNECQTCHQVESFCANCHQSEEADFLLGGVAPLSHINPDFKTFGAGSGGGEHAILARRDIESCTACHDVQGSDPTCITCHLDSDGIRGTNPKTHASNFMRDVEGDWHQDIGSICYNCHTSATPQSPQSSGFCNYCHGI